MVSLNDFIHCQMISQIYSKVSSSHVRRASSQQSSDQENRDVGWRGSIDRFVFLSINLLQWTLWAAYEGILTIDWFQCEISIM